MGALRQRVIGKYHLVANARHAVVRLVWENKEHHVVGEGLTHMLAREFHSLLGGGAQSGFKYAAFHEISLQREVPSLFLLDQYLPYDPKADGDDIGRQPKTQKRQQDQHSAPPPRPAAIPQQRKREEDHRQKTELEARDTAPSSGVGLHPQDQHENPDGGQDRFHEPG